MQGSHEGCEHCLLLVNWCLLDNRLRRLSFPLVSKSFHWLLLGCYLHFFFTHFNIFVALILLLQAQALHLRLILQYASMRFLQEGHHCLQLGQADTSRLLKSQCCKCDDCIERFLGEWLAESLKGVYDTANMAPLYHGDALPDCADKGHSLVLPRLTSLSSSSF